MRFIRTAWVAAAALLAAPCFAGQWYEDFEGGGLDDWVIYNEAPEVESWEEVDGVLVGEIFSPNSYSILHLMPMGEEPRTWKNYTVRVRMRAESAPVLENTSPFFGVLLYDFDLELNQFHQVIMYMRWQDVTARALGSDGYAYKSYLADVREGVWYDLYASIQTLDDFDRMTFRMEEEVNPVTQEKRTIAEAAINWPFQIRSGGVGLLVRDARVSFDDFVLEGPNIPNGGTGGPWAVSPIGMAAQLWGDLKR